MTSIICTLDKKNKNSFGVYEIIKKLKKSLLKKKIYYYLINDLNFSELNKRIKYSEIVHIQGCWSLLHLSAFIFSKIHGKKIFFSPHGMLMPEALKINYIKKKIALFFYQKIIIDNSDKVIVNSFKEKKEILKITKNKNINIIPHGIKVNKSNYFKKNNKKLKFVFYSRIHPIKGLYDLVKIWNTSDKLKDIKLDVYGKIENKSYFKFVKKNLGKNIEYCGSVNPKNKYKILKKYDVLVFPSFSENFGMVILEALNCGMFVIMRKGLPWSFLPPRSAKLINFNQKSLEKTINLTIKLRKKKVDKVKKKNFLLNNFCIDHINEQYLKIYKY